MDARDVRGQRSAQRMYVLVERVMVCWTEWGVAG